MLGNFLSLILEEYTQPAITSLTAPIHLYAKDILPCWGTRLRGVCGEGRQKGRAWCFCHVALWICNLNHLFGLNSLMLIPVLNYAGDIQICAGEANATSHRFVKVVRGPWLSPGNSSAASPRAPDLSKQGGHNGCF